MIGVTNSSNPAARPPSRRSPGAGSCFPLRGDLLDAVLCSVRRHGNLVRACREALGREDEGRQLEQRVRRCARRDSQFAALLAAARAAGRAN